MKPYLRVYEFGASVGALEGYVYRREEVDLKALPIWIGNLLEAYRLLPDSVLDEIQPALDMTLGRAFKSLSLLLGENHGIVVKVRSMIKGGLPESPDDFQKKKWFQE
jgi:hypothetical protein